VSQHDPSCLVTRWRRRGQNLGMERPRCTCIPDALPVIEPTLAEEFPFDDGNVQVAARPMGPLTYCTECGRDLKGFHAVECPKRPR
jgi:hypothetical protein